MTVSDQTQSFEFRGTLTEKQFRRIQWVASRKVLLAGCACLLVFMGMNLASGGATVVARDPILQGARFAPFVLLIPLFLLIPWWQASRQFRATPSLRGEVFGRLSDKGIEFTSVVSQARYRWDQVLKAKVASDVALVYTSPQIALYLPKVFFSADADWAGATALIRQKVAKVSRA
jgi:hypothetical protein